jgi:cell division protein FtsB
LDNLEQRGFITRLPYAARSIELTAKARGQQKSHEELQAEVDRLRIEVNQLRSKVNYWKDAA